MLMSLCHLILCSRFKYIQRERTQHPAHQVKIAVLMRAQKRTKPVPAQANVKLVSTLYAYLLYIFTSCLFFKTILNVQLLILRYTSVSLIWLPSPPQMKRAYRLSSMMAILNPSNICNSTISMFQLLKARKAERKNEHLSWQHWKCLKKKTNRRQF